MTKNQKEEYTNLKISAILIVVASVLVIAAASPQSAMATICPPMCADIDVEEAAEAGNATSMADSGMNQTNNDNMTGTNSTS